MSGNVDVQEVKRGNSQESPKGRLVGIKFYSGKDIPENIRDLHGISETDVVKKEIREINPRVSSLDKTEGFLTEFRKVFHDRVKTK